MFLIITGFGRSGTSVIARFAQLCGMDLRGGWVDIVDAGAEDPMVRLVNASIQARLDGRTKGEFFSDDNCKKLIKGLEVDGAKCPHFGTHGGEILRYWHECRQDISVIYTIREPEKCLKSRIRAAEIQGKDAWWGPCGEDINKFYEDFYGCIQTMEQLGINYQVLKYPEFLQNFDRVGYAFQETTEFCASQEIWDKVVRPDKVHIK